MPIVISKAFNASIPPSRPLEPLATRAASADANRMEPAPTRPDLASLAAALEASWDHRTSYGGVTEPGNPALGQCYPTARVVQYFHPETDIACGEVWTGATTECHFWNVRGAEWIDLSWQQFPPGSIVRDFKLLDRDRPADSPPTVERCALLLRRVLAHLGQ